MLFAPALSRVFFFIFVALCAILTTIQPRLEISGMTSRTRPCGARKYFIFFLHAGELSCLSFVVVVDGPTDVTILLGSSSHREELGVTQDPLLGVYFPFKPPFCAFPLVFCRFQVSWLVCCSTMAPLYLFTSLLLFFLKKPKTHFIRKDK